MLDGRRPLTPQQQAIVAHDTGPALVYAVAGSGKTTAMVHRIARLVDEGLFPAWQILATSFNRDANRQIETALRRWPACADVRVKTLHGVGYAVIRLARERGYLPQLDLDGSQRDPAAVERTVLHATLTAARSEGVSYAPRLDSLDLDHFIAYLRVCKGNLMVPGAQTKGLPRRMRKITQRISAPQGHAHYVDLYCRYEAMRLQLRLLGFDDMLVTGWELLARHEDLLAETRRRYRCVLVDEYQDVNRAQAEMLDLITAPHAGHKHRNLMAIGDDDQTIYEWRGASPDHMRTFRRRYRGAATYFMTDNFRSQASQLVLANQVVQQEPQRQRKYLQLTRGFDGTTTLDLHPNEATQANAIVRQVVHLRQSGHRLADMAILVRVYAQSTPLTTALHHEGIEWTLADDENGAERRRESVEHGRASRISILSIYRAKGLEWPIVFVPGCNDGTMPLARTQNMAEERRLLYVALTRARDHLRLHALADKQLSPFLEQAQIGAILAATSAIREALATAPEQWMLDDYLAVGVNAKRLYFHEFFAHWWQASPTQRRGVAEAVLRFYATLRRKRLFRTLGLQRQDVALWRQVIGERVVESPLDRPDVEEALKRLAR